MYLKRLLSYIHVFVVDCEIEIFKKKTLPSEEKSIFRLFVDVDVDFMTRFTPFLETD